MKTGKVNLSGTKSARCGAKKADWEAGKTKRWAAGLFIALIFMYNQIGALAQNDSTARAACVLEVETGRVLFEKEMHRRLPMASTTKVMTALLALERGELTDAVTCSKRAFGVPGTSIYLAEGETLTLEEMLLGLMLASGNDAAAAIAEHIGGSLPQFVQLMNERARELGAKNTHFANPHGLPDDTHVTTAYDLALIAREAMKNPLFRRLVSTKEATISWQGRDYGRKLHNKNRLLRDYPGATGIKTGFTSRAGRCLVFGAERDGMELVGVVLGCANWFNEAARLLDRCFERYSFVRVLGPGQSAGQIPVLDGKADKTQLCVMQDMCLPLEEGERVQLVLDVPEALRAPVYPGMHAGTAHLVSGSEILMSAEVVAANRVDSKRIVLDVRRVMACWEIE